MPELNVVFPCNFGRKLKVLTQGNVVSRPTISSFIYIWISLLIIQISEKYKYLSHGILPIDGLMFTKTNDNYDDGCNEYDE